MNLSWIKTIPNYMSYFNQDHHLIIDLIGIDNYFKLYETFGKTGIYFPVRQDIINNDREIISSLIGDGNYLKLWNCFGKGGIYFSSSSIMMLKKTWAIINHHIDRIEAARLLDVSTKTIYNWRQEQTEVEK